MSLVDNKTYELWHGFMSQKNTIKNTVGTDFYSVQLYDKLGYFESFDPQSELTKFAGIEVTDFENIPNGFGNMTIEEGLYAVFVHKEPASKFPGTIKYIFSQWLPNSEYLLDQRAHFELLGEKYKNSLPDSEEEVWIPIKTKNIVHG